MPHFNPMRVLDVGLAHDFASCEATVPKDLESQPIIGTMKLAGATIPLHRFTSFVPTPDTQGQIDELPFLAGQGVGLIHDVLPVAQIINSMVAEAVSALSAVHGITGCTHLAMTPETLWNALMNREMTNQYRGRHAGEWQYRAVLEGRTVLRLRPQRIHTMGFPEASRGNT
jgi:hypothetical protein